MQQPYLQISICKRNVFFNFFFLANNLLVHKNYDDNLQNLVKKFVKKNDDWVSQLFLWCLLDNANRLQF